MRKKEKRERKKGGKSFFFYQIFISLDREIDWPKEISLIGHSLVIHKLSVKEWSLRNKDVLPLACGTIGFASH